VSRATICGGEFGLNGALLRLMNTSSLIYPRVLLFRLWMKGATVITGGISACIWASMATPSSIMRAQRKSAPGRSKNTPFSMTSAINAVMSRSIS
jgi:hypothetical protein